MHLHATIVQELSDQIKTYNNTTIILSVNLNFIKYNFTIEYLTILVGLDNHEIQQGCGQVDGFLRFSACRKCNIIAI